MKIFDTSAVVCLLKEIEFPKILDLCIANNYSIAITKQVHEELKLESVTINKFEQYGKFEIIDGSSDVCLKKIQNRYPMLHSGEISVICNSLSRKSGEKQDHCIIDEKEARRLRDDIPVFITGTIGLIKWHKEHGRLSQEECTDIYSRIKNSGFRISLEILNEILK